MAALYQRRRQLDFMIAYKIMGVSVDFLVLLIRAENLIPHIGPPTYQPYLRPGHLASFSLSLGVG